MPAVETMGLSITPSTATTMATTMQGEADQQLHAAADGGLQAEASPLVGGQVAGPVGRQVRDREPVSEAIRVRGHLALLSARASSAVRERRS